MIVMDAPSPHTNSLSGHPNRLSDRSLFLQRKCPLGGTQTAALMLCSVAEAEISSSASTPAAFSLSGLSKNGPSPEEEVVQPDEPDPDEDDEAYQSDPEAEQDRVTTVPAYMTPTTEETTTAHPPAFDSCL
ncbi:uncharacterized protein [Misgurnus anguillicaudatus]|uniref:uncharacterized protein isoform X4 n=1 Tax=Misgurnus anguillicaudatus TaxID=75329 RepID=UPI003CCF6769